MPFRLLRYNIATIADHLEQNNEHLPVIVNMVFYHGSEPWNYSTALADYYKDRELGARYLDMAPFILVSCLLAEKMSSTETRIGILLCSLSLYKQSRPLSGVVRFDGIFPSSRSIFKTFQKMIVI